MVYSSILMLQYLLEEQQAHAAMGSIFIYHRHFVSVQNPCVSALCQPPVSGFHPATGTGTGTECMILGYFIFLSRKKKKKKEEEEEGKEEERA